MTNTNVTLVLRLDKIKKNGEAPIWLRMTTNRKTKYKSTGEACLEKDWDDAKKRVKKSNPYYLSINQRLERLLHEVRELSYESTSVTQIKMKLAAPKGKFSRLFSFYIDYLYEADRIWEWKKFKVTDRKLARCFGQDYHNLDRESLTTFENFLRRECENGANTVQKEFQKIRRVVRWAIRSDFLEPAEDPFLKFDIPRGVDTNRRRLSEDEVDKLVRIKLPTQSNFDLSRDCFLLSFYCGGVRFGDLCRLGSANFTRDRLSYRMNKTKQHISLLVPPKATQIVDKYKSDRSQVFPFLWGVDVSDGLATQMKISSSNALINKYLKKVAKKAFIDPCGLSMHCSRHTFADLARKKSNGDVYAVSKALGHSSIAITQKYLDSLDQNVVDGLISNIWS